MRLLLYLILCLAFNRTYCQDSNKTVQILSYRHGCHGNCDYSYDDSCGLAKDSTIEIIKITKIKDKYYKNGKFLIKQNADSLNLIISENIGIIKKLIFDISNEKYLKFVPPRPKCYEFEEFKINYKGEILNLKILLHVGNGITNEDGCFLHGKEIEFYIKLVENIK
jgi:hypothetical protein